MDYNTILNMRADELLKWLIDNFTLEMPSEIITVEDMNEAAKSLLKLTSNYSYVCALLSASKVAKREAKRSMSAEEYQNMVDKCDIVQNITDVVKQQYNAISRAVTIHIDNNMELRMNSSGTIRGK